MSEATARREWVERVLGVTVTAPRGLDVRFAAVEQTWLKAMAADPPNRTRLSAMMAFITEQMAEGDAGRAGAALDRLEAMLATPDAPSRPGAKGSGEALSAVVRSDGQLVAYRKSLLAWDAAKKSAAQQLTDLKGAITTAWPALVQAAGVVERAMDQLNTGLSQAIDAAINAKGTSERGRQHAFAAALARSYLTRVTFHPAFALLDGNKLMPLRLRATLGDALKQVVAAIPV